VDESKAQAMEQMSIYFNQSGCVCGSILFLLTPKREQCQRLRTLESSENISCIRLTKRVNIRTKDMLSWRSFSQKDLVLIIYFLLVNFLGNMARKSFQSAIWQLMCILCFCLSWKWSQMDKTSEY